HDTLRTVTASERRYLRAVAASARNAVSYYLCPRVARIRRTGEFSTLWGDQYPGFCASVAEAGRATSGVALFVSLGRNRETCSGCPSAGPIIPGWRRMSPCSHP